MSDLRNLLESDKIAHAISKLFDERVCIHCFAKTYQPQEQEKLKKIQMKLDFYKRRYPERFERAWEVLRKGS